MSKPATLVCVSKYQSIDKIQQAYEAGERDFGESRVQELLNKQQTLPKDIRWHMIGHLQTNKVRLIIPFIHLIQSVDSEHLLEVINKEAAHIGRIVNVLLEVHVAREDSKSGLTPEAFMALIPQLPNYTFVRVCGLMGMSTNTNDEQEIRRCFEAIRSLSLHLPQQSPILSMGMSSDYLLAIDEGSTMVRIGSSIFGLRN